MPNDSTTSSPGAPADEPVPVAFCLHALGASSREFDRVAERLTGHIEVVALDLPGFGEQSAASGITVDEMVTSVIARIRLRSPGRFLLVGHSMGGKVASLVAERTMSGKSGLFGLAGIVLLAASPPSPEPMDDDRRETMLSWAADGPLSETAAREFIDANVGSPLDAEADASMMRDLLRTSPEAWRGWLQRGSREDRSADVGVSALPAIIIAGGEDGDLGEAGQRALNSPVYPEAQVIVLSGAGHLLPLERPEEVAAAIGSFWDGLAGLGPVVPADFASMIASSRTSARTRGILARRSIADDPDYSPRILTSTQLSTLRALADEIVPQDGARIDIAARVDAQLAAGAGDGWRNADLPADPEAYRLALDTLADVVAMSGEARQRRIRDLVSGEFSPDTGGLSAAQLTLWFEDCRVDLVRQWLAHPATMARIGYDAIANGGDGDTGRRLLGFQLLAAGERESWEPAMGATR